MRTDIAPRQTSDYLEFDLIITDNLLEPKVLLADRGYDADRILKGITEHDITPNPDAKKRGRRGSVSTIEVIA